MLTVSFVNGLSSPLSRSDGKSNLLQNIIVSGKVLSGADSTGLPGASVLVKGTTRGTVTDGNGNFSIEVPSADAILVISFVGYDTQEISVGGRTRINITLGQNAQALEEVVVTALGITRKEKSLGYSVGKVGGDDLNRVVQENAINSLAGKVSGVQISSTGGAGSSVSMVIRGATSLSNDNQPLFVIDGVPIVNSLNNVSGFGADNRVDYGNAISDLNSEDIESVSVLKGPSAAALYGSRAGNGVVLITTKSGRKNQGAKVEISSNTVFDIPYHYYSIQKKFANGYFSYTPDDFAAGHTLVVNPSEMAGAGIELDKEYFAVQWNSPKDANGVQIPTELVSHPDNVANFVQTGITTTNGVAVSNSNDVINYRIGVTNMSSRGVVPNSDLFRNSVTQSSAVKVRKNLTVSSNLNINTSWSNNRPSSNKGTNPMQWAYNVPQNTDIRELSNYWEPGKEGVTQYVPYKTYNNPYFLAYEVKNSFKRDRIYGNIKGDWQISKAFSLMARYALDSYSENRESKIAPGYIGEPNNGAYGIQEIKAYERNIDFLATFTKDLKSFTMTISGGGNALYKTGSSISNSSKPGIGLVVPNVYSVSNIKSAGLNYGSSWYQKAVYSVYGLANLGFKNMVYVDFTARNDWSSTLPKENWSYFYPSASLSLLVDQMVDLGSSVSLFKLRGGWAKAGNDTDPYQLYSVYDNAGQWGEATRLAKPGQILTPNLKPEEATSMEGGLDLRFFDNRIRLEGTYYTVDNRNQIIRSIPVASSTGSDVVNINAGLIRSKGWEFTMGFTPVKSANWMWDISANFTRNRTKVVEIAPGVDVIKFWEDAKGGAWSYVGDEVGDIYDAQVITVTDENSPYYGFPIISSTPDYEWQEIKMQDTRNKIGNYNPNFIMGAQSALTFKSFTLNFTIDWRNGGQFISQTDRAMSEAVNSQAWLDRLINPGGRTGKELRDWLMANKEEYILNGFHVVGGPTVEYGGFREDMGGIAVNDGTFVPGVIAVDDGNGGIKYVENLGEEGTLVNPFILSNAWNFARPFMYDADFVKLREISLSYRVPDRIVRKLRYLQGLNVSVFSRNIILWTKANIGIDPERAFQAETSASGNRGTQFKQGIESYNLDPWTMPIGFKIDLTF